MSATGAGEVTGATFSLEEKERVLISEAVYPPFGKPEMHKIPHKSSQVNQMPGNALGLELSQRITLKKLFGMPPGDGS